MLESNDRIQPNHDDGRTEMANVRETGWPSLPGDKLGKWLEPAYGDVRDDVRAALAANSDMIGELRVVACALGRAGAAGSTLTEEERQIVLRSTAGMVHECADTLDAASRFLWDCVFAWENDF